MRRLKSWVKRKFSRQAKWEAIADAPSTSEWSDLSETRQAEVLEAGFVPLKRALDQVEGEINLQKSLVEKQLDSTDKAFRSLIHTFKELKSYRVDMIHHFAIGLAVLEKGRALQQLAVKFFSPSFPKGKKASADAHSVASSLDSDLVKYQKDLTGFDAKKRVRDLKALEKRLVLELRALRKFYERHVDFERGQLIQIKDFRETAAGIKRGAKSPRLKGQTHAKATRLAREHLERVNNELRKADRVRNF